MFIFFNLSIILKQFIYDNNFCLINIGNKFLSLFFCTRSLWQRTKISDKTITITTTTI